MTPFHSLFPEVAQGEVRCVHIGAGPGSGPLALGYGATSVSACLCRWLARAKDER